MTCPKSYNQSVRPILANKPHHLTTDLMNAAEPNGQLLPGKETTGIIERSNALALDPSLSPSAAS